MLAICEDCEELIIPKDVVTVIGKNSVVGKESLRVIRIPS